MFHLGFKSKCTLTTKEKASLFVLERLAPFEKRSCEDVW